MAINRSQSTFVWTKPDRNFVIYRRFSTLETLKRPLTPLPKAISIDLAGGRKAYATRPENNMGNFQKKEKLPNSATMRSFSVKKNAKVNLCDLLQHF